MLRHKQTTLEFWLGPESVSEESTPKPITRYVKHVPRVSPIIHREHIPVVDVDDGRKTVKKFKITVRGEH